MKIKFDSKKKNVIEKSHKYVHHKKTNCDTMSHYILHYDYVCNTYRCYEELVQNFQRTKKNNLIFGVFFINCISLYFQGINQFLNFII